MRFFYSTNAHGQVAGAPGSGTGRWKRRLP
uniref:Aminophospholipid ATPase n=1 Tax=Arundo donax TaxID=35708 RepID=A0A0A9E2P4_ARUDO